MTMIKQSLQWKLADAAMRGDLARVSAHLDWGANASAEDSRAMREAAAGGHTENGGPAGKGDFPGM